MKQNEKTIIAVVLMMYVFFSLALGSWNPLEWRRMTVTPPTEQPKPGAVAGMYTIKVQGFDVLDIMGTPPAEGTAFEVYVMALRGGSYILLGSVSSNQATVEVTPQDGGYVYIVCEVKSGQTWYIDWAETRNRNPRVASVTYEDPDSDGYKEYVFKFNMADIPKPATGYPEVYFYPYLIAYQQPSLNNLANLTSVGTATVRKYLEWYASFTNEKKGYAISKVEFTVNTTDTSKLKLVRMNIPGIGYISGDQFGTPLRGTSSLTWTYNIGSNLHTAHYIKYSSNMLNKFEFTTEVELSLGGSDVLTVTITIYGFSPSGTLETITKTVYIAAGSL